MSAAGSPGDRAAIVNGFTLIEMLVILAILSLVAGIVFPSLDKAMRSQTFAASKVRIELGLRAARAVAIRSGAPVRFATANRHGFVYGRVVEQLPASTVITLPDRGIAFFADGSATGGDVSIADGRLAQRWRVLSTTGAIERQP